MQAYTSNPAYLSGYGTGDNCEGPCCPLPSCGVRCLPSVVGGSTEPPAAAGILTASAGLGNKQATGTDAPGPHVLGPDAPGPEDGILLGAECCCEADMASESKGSSLFTVTSMEANQGKGQEHVLSPAVICGYGSCDDDS